MKKIESLMKKTGKPAEPFATFDGKKLVLDACAGTAYTQIIGELDLEKDTGIEKRRDILDKIYEKNKKPVTNLDLGNFEQALGANRVSDFAAARAQIAKMVNAKIVPAFKKEVLPKLEEELKFKEKQFAEYSETVNMK